MKGTTSNLVQSLNTAGASKVQVGNNYNTTNNYHRESDQDDTKKLLEKLRSTDPRHDKINIEQTNNHLLRDAYKWILENPQFVAWRDESHGSQLLWIKGDAGKGKTMLLCGIINELLSSTRLANPDSLISLSYFFCQATNSRLNNAEAVMRGLIYLLVGQQPCLLSHLRANIHWDSRVALEDLFRKIVADPALEKMYLIVDALDECLEDLAFLLELISSPIPRIKWIVSSRNRCEIGQGLQQPSSNFALSLELNKESVSQAVRCFIDYRTKELVERKKVKTEEAQKVQRYLTENSNDTFLWVGLVCQRLRRCHVWEITRELNLLPKGLNKLYARMVDQIRTSDSSELYIRLLAIVCTVFRPLTFPELMAMDQLDLNEETLHDLIWECGSFLTTQDKTILFVHQSAKDFLLKESSDLLFQSGLAHHHYALFQRSIDILKSLHKDLYNLVYPGVSLEAAIHNRPKPDPLESLAYALACWADHLREAFNLSTQDNVEVEMPFMETVRQFLYKKLLFWLEALILCHNPSVAGKSLLFLKNLPAVLFEADLVGLIKDALRFLFFFGPVIENYPLQIYASGLLFSPQKSIIRHLFKQYTPDFIAKPPKVDEIWSPTLGVFETSLWTQILTMRFSPTSDTLVITTSNSELVLWKVNDGSIHKRTSYNNATLLTLSPDLQWLAVVVMCSSTDTEELVQDALEVRDFSSDSILWCLKLDGRKATAIKVTPDSRWLAVCYEQELHLYAREGGLSQSWALETGPDTTISSFLACRMSFSSDGALLLLPLRRENCNIVVFGLRTGVQYKFPSLYGLESNEIDEINKSEVSCEKQYLTDAKFIPNTHRVMISAINSRMFFWDIYKGQCEYWHRFHSPVGSFSFSHNESWLAIASNRDVFLFHPDKEIFLPKLQLPTEGLDREIEVSYDDKRIAVFSNNTAYLLDVQTFLTHDTSFSTDDWTSSLIFDDGVSFAFLNSKMKMKIENNITGRNTMLKLPRYFHLSASWIALSSDGRILVCNIGDELCIYDLERNSLQHTINIEDWVMDITISPSGYIDDQLLAVCGITKILVWDIRTAQLRQSVDYSDKAGGCPNKVCFAGTWLGVLWCFSTISGNRQDGIFTRYNIETGQQLLPELNLPGCELGSDTTKCGGFSVSPNGKWMVSHIVDARQLLLSDVEVGVHCAFINMTTSDFSFIDDLALWTGEGVIYPDRIIDSLTAFSDTDERELVEVEGQAAQEWPLISPLVDKYGRSTGREWITLDGKPLIWLPQQYRLNTKISRAVMAIGHHHVTIESSSGIYCVVFRQGTEDYLRKEMNRLFA